MENKTNYNTQEGNEYLLGEKFKGYLNQIINQYDQESKLDIIKSLLDILLNLEDLVYSNDIEKINLVKDTFGDAFEIFVIDMNPLIEEMGIRYLKDLILQQKQSTTEIESLTTKESIYKNITEALDGSGLKLSAELGSYEENYLKLNPKEYKVFLIILKFVSEIKKLPGLKNTPLRNKHILSLTNYNRIEDQYKFTGIKKETEFENNPKHININNCISTRLSGKDRFIFRLFDSMAQNPEYNDTIYTIVLGDPDYKHD